MVGWLGFKVGLLATAARGGLKTGRPTHVRDGAAAIHPSYCVVTRSLAQVLGVGVGGELGVLQGSSSAVVPLDDESLAVVWSLVGLTLLVEFLFLVFIWILRGSRLAGSSIWTLV